jgi:hypothetical protein
LVAAALALLGPVAAARAESTSFRGLTGVGRAITLTTTTDGQAQEVVVRWQPRCKPRATFPIQTTTFVPADGEDAAAPAFVGTANFDVKRLPGARAASVTMRITGALNGTTIAPTAQMWTGRLRVRATLTRNGRPAGTCRLSVPWKAGREGVGSGTFAMDSDAGDWLGGGQPWRYDPTNATMSAKGTPSAVFVTVDGQDGRNWQASFSAPSLNSLRPGQRYVPDSSVPGAASFSVMGDGRSCDAMPGSFVVQAIRFDRLGRLTDLRVDYETHCDNNPPGNRGSFEWHAAR